MHRDRLLMFSIQRVINANLFDRFTRGFVSFTFGHFEAVDLTCNKYASFVIEINNISHRSIRIVHSVAYTHIRKSYC